MDKRLISVFTVFCMIIGCLCLRLYTLGSGNKELVSSDSHYSSFSLYNIRGNILDCKGRKITGSDYDNYIISKPSIESLAIIKNIADSKTYSQIREKMQSGSPIMYNIKKNIQNSNKNMICVPVFKRYSMKQPAQHIIGYLDENKHGVSGIEKAYDNILYSDGYTKVRVPIDAYGRTIAGSEIQIEADTVKVGSLKLTIDLDIQNIVEHAIDECNIKEGCAIVLDINTGAIRAIASRPVYDTDRLSDSLNSKSSPFLDRSLSEFAVGSIFKVAVAAAAIENGYEDYIYECKGVCNIGGVNFSCSSNKSHGKINMQKALEVSCNTYFINLGHKVGADLINEEASILGFGQSVNLCHNISTASGTIPTDEDLKNPAALANYSFGQGKFTATPFQIAQMISAVANNGKYYKPYIVDSITDKTNIKSEYMNKYPIYAMKEETAQKLTKMMISVVNNGNASQAKPEKFDAAGKTATAQTGIFDSNGNEICNTWFGGFFPADKPAYVAVIMKQKGISGSSDCAPAFKKIADGIGLIK